MIIDYLKQNTNGKYSFNSPKSYADFYDQFLLFKEKFGLNQFSNYEIDKFLWQYGKNTIVKIMSSEHVSRDKAKSMLKKRITRLYPNNV